MAKGHSNARGLPHRLLISESRWYSCADVCRHSVDLSNRAWQPRTCSRSLWRSIFVHSLEASLVKRTLSYNAPFQGQSPHPGLFVRPPLAILRMHPPPAAPRLPGLEAAPKRDRLRPAHAGSPDLNMNLASRSVLRAHSDPGVHTPARAVPGRTDTRHCGLPRHDEACSIASSFAGQVADTRRGADSAARFDAERVGAPQAQFLRDTRSTLVIAGGSRFERTSSRASSRHQRSSPRPGIPGGPGPVVLTGKQIPLDEGRFPRAFQGPARSGEPRIHALSSPCSACISSGPHARLLGPSIHITCSALEAAAPHAAPPCAEAGHHPSRALCLYPSHLQSLRAPLVQRAFPARLLIPTRWMHMPGCRFRRPSRTPRAIPASAVAYLGPSLPLGVRDRRAPCPRRKGSGSSSSRGRGLSSELHTPPSYAERSRPLSETVDAHPPAAESSPADRTGV
ncbi:hypothetical protein B0H17DRAFT_208617 [Mycena rosella]|uniref:Uncharacterized protein n=1 Tax=Mycena rosella TaxID=1033263 RepID=A0AAD7CXQ3_MYCRO|nr:hypothetical protein B0H17DRAFT_208617 [Mycena rosella]